MKSKDMTSEGRSALASATVKHIRIAPQKARLIVDLIRGRQVEPAMQILRFNSKKGARFVEKLLRSAIDNARESAGADTDKLWVTRAWVGEGRTIKRFMPRARGSANSIFKRSSHITLVVGEK